MFLKNGSWISRNTYFKYYWNRRYANINLFLKAYLSSLQKTEDVVFIQIGSSNQIGWPVEAHISDNWKNILVEPIPEKATELKEKYKGENFFIENTAVTEKKEKKPFHIAESKNDIPDWVSYLSSFKTFNIEWLKKTYPDINIRTSLIDTITFEELTNKYNLKKVNILQIDTEGYDYEILNSIDFSKVQIDFIIYEHCHLSHKEMYAIKKMKRKNHYTFFSENLNTAFFRKNIYKHLSL